MGRILRQDLVSFVLLCSAIFHQQIWITEGLKCYTCSGKIGDDAEAKACAGTLFSCRPTSDICAIHYTEDTFEKSCATKAVQPILIPERGICNPGLNGECFCSGNGCNTTKEGICRCLSSRSTRAAMSDSLENVSTASMENESDLIEH